MVLVLSQVWAIYRFVRCLEVETSVLSLDPGIPDSQHVELISENETGILSPE